MGLKLDQLLILLAGKRLVGPLSFDVAPGAIVTVMGASGSGKSSLLAYIAGDLSPPLTGTGKVSLNGSDLNHLPPEARRIGRLFQDDMLFPHMTVRENLLFGVPRGPRAGREAAVETALKEAGLPGFGERPPHTLSGGQRQRVALMRALLAQPSAMLLDEPFSKLDETLRGSIRGFVFSHLKERSVPAILVTHDRSDAPAGGLILRIGENGGAPHV